jgi:predicted  nucleic acid-binding Zn-ribbon protein
LSNSSFHLYQLQKVDLRLDHLNQRLEKIALLLNNNPRLVEAQNQVNLTLSIIHGKEDELAKLEQTAAAKKIKIDQSEAALYNGKIINPKELKDLQAEINSLKRAVGTVEDEQLTLMSQLEEIHLTLLQDQKSYDSVLAESESDNQQLFGEKSELDKEKEKLITERQAASGQIQAEVMNIYEKLRMSKNHIAVSAIEDQSCATCGSEITASDIQKARSSTSLSFCPSCGRIIYAG